MIMIAYNVKRISSYTKMIFTLIILNIVHNIMIKMNVKILNKDKNC